MRKHGKMPAASPAEASQAGARVAAYDSLPGR